MNIVAVIRRPAPAADRATARLVTAAHALATSPISYASTRGAGLSGTLTGGGDTTAALAAFGTEPTLFACVTQISQAVASTRWCLYRKAPNRRPEDRTEVDGDHLARDLWEMPADEAYDQQAFVETFEQHLELAGMAYWVLGIDPRMPGVPQSMWPVRPDRMTVVPGRKRWAEGFVYTDPDGQKVPFAPEEVVWLRTPDPLDPYHGLGPVRALLTDLDSSRFAAEWNRAFFRNSAEPGGIIEVAEVLGDEDFRTLKRRWDEQHQGASNAHRVAIIEGGMKWVDRSYSMRDLQFVDLRRFSAEQIMLAFGLSKTLLGQTESVNRATAEAAEYVFGKYKLVPRLDRIRSVLNRRILPRFAGGDTLEWDYASPVTGNAETEIAQLNARVAAVVALAALGYDVPGLCEAFDVPVGMVTWAPPAAAPAPAPVGPATDPEFAALAAQVAAALALPRAPIEITARDTTTHQHEHGPGCGRLARVPVRPRNAGDPPDLDPSDLPDVTRLQHQFDRILDGLLDDWATLEQAQKDDLVAQVLAIATHGSLEDLANLSIDTTAAAQLLAAAMAAAGVQASDALREEAAEQGVDITPVSADKSTIDGVATVVAGLIATRLIGSAAATAMRANGPGITPRQVADKVAEALADLSTDGPRRQLAGSITGAQNDARLATLRRAPEAAIYAAEVNDANTCRNCKQVDGKWLGNSPSDLDEITELYPGGAYGGYVDCLGRENCRGTICGVWRRGAS